MTAKITKSVVDAAKPAEKDSFIWDAELKGFGLKTTPKGRKVYIVQYRPPGHSTRRHTIGQHGSPWTPSTARQEALRVLGLVAAGADPREERRLAKTDITLSELCDLYLEKGTASKKASTIAMDRSRINAHVKPLLGRKRLKQISKADVSAFLRSIAEGRTSKDVKTGPRGRSIVKGGPGVANRSLGMLAAIFEFAVENEFMSFNPARGVKKFKEGRPARFLSQIELGRLGDALKRAEIEGANLYALAAIRLLLLTGCRRNEILELKWEEVDFENGFLRLSDSKTGAKTIPLGSAALEIISSLPRHKDNPYVIIGEKLGGHLVGIQKVWAKVRASADLADVRIHDLRHSFASIGARSGESLLVIGKVLGHSTTSATSRYAHLSEDPVRQASDRISEYVSERL
ncbi:MAG: tyrosine-type recombinase/integrase, partial [Pseudomonadota bacterium]